jgi:uncharacterized membrane protein YagU involved in acid resistance
MRPDPLKAILGGFVGTSVMTLMMYFVAPMMLGKPMDIAAMLGSMLGGSWAMGLLMHFANGSIIFPLIYVYGLYRLLPGEPWLRGTIWGLILWLLAQALVMPMMGAGVFSAHAGGLMAVMASLIGHVVYGALLGGIAGRGEARAER